MLRRLSTGPAAVILAFLIGAVVATAGSAAATRLITGAQVRDGTIQAKDLSKNLRRQLRVKALPGPTGPKGDVGPQGPAGTARSFGRIDSSGTLLAAHNVTMTHPALGIWCLRPTVPFDPDGPVITTLDMGNDRTSTGTGAVHQAVAEMYAGAPDCPKGDLQVTTILTSATDAVPSDEGFAFLVP